MKTGIMPVPWNISEKRLIWEMPKPCHISDVVISNDAISEKRYKGILTGSKIVAGFVVSQKPFDDCEAVNDNNADRLYVEGVVISPRISDVIYDVLHDFIVINCMERGAKWLSLKLDKNSGFAHYLASEDAYKLAGTTVEYIYFDVDVANFD